MRYFDRLHPIPSLFYFVAVLAVAMLTRHPVIVSICYLSGVVFCGMLIGIRRLLKSLLYTVPLMLLLALTNPLFVHRGQTALFFLNGRPVTLEALIYGAVSAVMIMAVFYWCRCYSQIMTSDKFVYLFGRAVPKLSLVLTMTLAFLPKMRRSLREIDDAQRAMGIYASQSYTDRIRGKLRALSVLLSNSLESSIDTADSMLARGYGLKGRSSYTVYRFTLGDGLYLALTTLFGSFCVVLIFLGVSEFSYYPTLFPLDATIPSCLLYVALTLLTGSSVLMEVKETILWRYLKSKI